MRATAFLLGLAVLAATVSWPGAPAHATPFVVSFTGTITSVDGNLTAFFTGSEAVSGSYAFDSGATDTIGGDPDAGQYLGTNGSLHVGARTWSDSVPTVIVENDLAIFGDEYTVIGDSLSGPALGAFSASTWELTLQDSTATVFADDSLPTALSLTSFDTAQVRLRFSDGVSVFAADVVTDIGSLTVSVPEPAAAALLAAALAAAAGRRRRPAR